MLGKFAKYISTIQIKRLSADSTMLLVKDSNLCGVAYTDATPWCSTASLVKKDCATGGYR